MCDVCSDVLVLLENHDDRVHCKEGLHLNKKEIQSVLLYVCTWPQRQCMCCYKDFKNFERFNNIVQIILTVAIRFIQSLPIDYEKEREKEEEKNTKREQEAVKTDEVKCDGGISEEQKTEGEASGSKKDDVAVDDVAVDDVEMEEDEHWNIEEKEKLLQFVTKVFLMNFPSYLAYKHVVHSSLEELSQQETSALNNYCEISDPDVPLYLLRNVCFFCDSNGITSLKSCFEKATSNTLPFTFAHMLINLIANLRLWMNIPTIMQCIIPLRTSVIRYMCNLSDKDLRMAGSRSMTDLMWAAVKEPLDTHFTFDREGLELAFKYFTCSTLTIRLAGIAQLNNQITLYNESCNNETLVDAEKVGNEIAQWLIDKKIIEHIFGPNLHAELIKQNQMILNFLAVENRITNEHLDCIWAASQLKYCGKQVYDILIPLIKHLELPPVQHLLKLVSSLEPSAHTESTLYLVSALIKRVWNTCGATHHHVAAIQQNIPTHLQAYTAIRQEDEEMEVGLGKPGKHEVSSSESIHESEGEHTKQIDSSMIKSAEVGEGGSIHHCCHHQHKHVTGESESSLGIGSDFSEESEIDEQLVANEQLKRLRQIKLAQAHHAGLRGAGSDSEVECSESSDEHEHVKALVVHKRIHMHKGLKKKHVSGQEESEGDSSEMEECCEHSHEDEDSEYLNSEDEELMKEARLVKIKHLCHRESEDSSDFDDDDEEAKVIREVKLQCHAREVVQKHRRKQLERHRQQHLLHQAAQLVLQRQHKMDGRQQVVGHAKSNKSFSDDMEKGLGQSDENLEKMKVSDVGNTSQESLDSDIVVTAAVMEEYERQHHERTEKSEGEIETFDCSSIVQHLKAAHRNRQFQGEYAEDILSPDDGSCHSSHLSTKSDKNMADFEGEEGLSEEELAQINAHAHYNSQQMQQLNMYQNIPHCIVHHRPPQKDISIPSCPDSTFDDVCKKGNTLLWDLVQEDVACQLPEGLAVEAEKALCTLVCYSTDKRIRTKFIAACIDNLASHKSVVVSLRLLPKIFSSFQQYRSGADTHTITMWAEKELGMMTHFFQDLVHYNNTMNNQSNILYSHQEQVQVRLLFLTCVFSTLSPDGFRLNQKQVDELWDCLALDPECTDDCLSWFLNQAKSKDHHALGLETFKHIFLEKMPQLRSETMSMIGLNLFQQLSQLARVANDSLDNPMSEDQVCGMDQLWSIALRATDKDVSMAAIQYLNLYYIGFGNGLLDKEEEFIKRCMKNLLLALATMKEDASASLLIIKRGLTLLKTHLEAFKKRYSYHLRNWQIDSQGIISHQQLRMEKNSANVRILLQPGGMTEKTQLDMMSTDLVAELRAEVARWWETLQCQQQVQRKQAEGKHGLVSPILGAMLGDGPIRMITQGQELTVDMDEKTLGEMQFKDLQLVFVSVGASRQPRKLDGTLPSSSLPSPPRERLPMIILLQEPHFDNLFMLLQQLGDWEFEFSAMENHDRAALQAEARRLSRNVWELLLILPTCQNYLNGFKSLATEKVTGDSDGTVTVDWDSLLPLSSPHKLYYSLQIIESMSHSAKLRRKSLMLSGGGDATSLDSEEEATENLWNQNFVEKGGLSHLLKIFMSGTLQPKDDGSWSQWNQECLAYLLQLITKFAVNPADLETGPEDAYDIFESPKKKPKKSKSNQEKILIPRLNQSTVDMLNTESVLKILMQILYDAALPEDSNQMYIGSWGWAEVVHYAMTFLVSLAYSCDDVPGLLCTAPNFNTWLKRLTIESPEPYVRKEACMGLYKLRLGKTADNKRCYSFLFPILSSLLSLLPEALLFKPQKNVDFDGGGKEKEPFGPGCRDYFWLVCRVVDSISKEEINAESENIVDLNALAKDIAQHIVSRSYYETRAGYEEDDGLIGMLNLFTAVLKHNPQFKSSHEGQEFLDEISSCLFALPSPTKRYLPRCKSQASRAAAYDLLVEMVKGSIDNYTALHVNMMVQHTKDSHAPYPWDYWPHEDGRSKCGYVGLTNLGATCYMATCMQHLYMIPQARQSVLQAKCSDYAKHEGTLIELQKMFAYLQESERKAYNPKSFCKVYTMDKQPLNTGEQKDMTEFFTDLISKLEEMCPEMKTLVKSLFGGVVTNNVVSLDCPHVSRTFEEFYTVRCQVTDMKDLYESLDEVTVKDMLEGDNMYTCSKCQKKVRAEKRACFRKLPRILCFNTLRYTFNMVTMMKEKVNTHFSFPLRLDMSPYMEQNLMGPDKLQIDESEEDEIAMMGVDVTIQDESCEYELIGVTVHTGTADGGHYYSFIRDRLSHTENGQDKWFLFNDAEVKPFDPCQIASECFGGEMTSKTYDSVTDKFMDFSFEKTNSAYMLFYERFPADKKVEEIVPVEEKRKFNFELPSSLGEWIWRDNTQFLQDKNLFEHTYFSFMWQICGYIPTTLPKDDDSVVPLKAAQLSTSFVLETLIHAKEKPTMLQWIELLTKQFNSCHAACEWFLDHMAESDWWPQQILIKCPNQMVRQMFQRLVIHVISQLRNTHVDLYMQPVVEGDDGEIDISELGNQSCVTRFIKKMLAIVEHGVRPHSKYLTEYFAFLLEWSKTGDEECLFLINIGAISTMINFYMGQKAQENYVEILSDDDEEEDVISLTDDNYRPVALEKMIALIALLVEKSRVDEKQLQIFERDYSSIIGVKGFPFLFSQIRDNINVRQTCNLIFSLTRWSDSLAVAIVNMVFSAIRKLNPDQSQPFFKLLSMLVEFVGGPPGLPHYTQYVLQRFWELTKSCPQQCLEWLTNQVTRNKLAQVWCLNQMEPWVEQYLLAHNNVRVRNAAAYLLVSLIPSNHFRQSFRSARSMLSPHKELPMSTEALMVLHQVYEHLLSLLSRARLYVDPAVHGTTKLMCYFAVMNFCLISRVEKLMFGEYFLDMWQLFQPKLSEPQISMHHNKQTLLLFWHQVCLDCPENVKLIVSNPHVCKNIAFSYILADHDDQDVVMFNRVMLPAYYGLLRMCCQQSQSFTRQLAQHQNIQWAFKNITPYPTQYTVAVEELFKIMKLMATRYPDSTEEELKAISSFCRSNIMMYLQLLDGRSTWQTLISAFKILVETREERVLLIYHSGLQKITEAFYTLHVMYHEATACHVTGDIVDLLTILLHILETGKECHDKKAQGCADVKACLFSWKERYEVVKKLITLLNSYTPPEVRSICFEVLKQMILIFQGECINVMVPILTQAHASFQDSNIPVAMGPYFPRRGQKPIGSKSNIRPPRPQFQMFLLSSQIEITKGVDEVYDQALSDYILPYHLLMDTMVRVSVNQQNTSEALINLSAMVAFEGVPLHLPYFAKLWTEIYHSGQADKGYVQALCNSSSFIDYVDAVLLDERMSLNNSVIYQFFCNFFPKVYQQVLHDQGRSMLGNALLDSLVASVTAEKSAFENVKSDRELLHICNRLTGDLRAMLIIFSVQTPKQVSPLLTESLELILSVCRSHQQKRVEMETKVEVSSQQQDEETEAPALPEKQDKGEVTQELDSEQMQQQERGDDSDQNADSNVDVCMEDTTSAESEEVKEKTCEENTSADSNQRQQLVEEESGEIPSKRRRISHDADEEQQKTDRETPGDSGPHIQEDVEKTTTQKSPEPSTSSASEPPQPSTSTSSTGLSQSPRERPNKVDVVAKHIEMLLGLIQKQ
ncbi:ubiquitin carboxyl-terminal hydrolase 34-like isoform X3 [Gigantopelta aegis]|uniref:ubiquitin carboxyl-terminal hydrolase 34-like isoform X3 n=2 Tax=Gigantopelta aegis TaxID=1735272 RepID=UPI001B88C390|nr:ubiquitin carboxyl-terminal hydrolase 34-like isoform X3 [Gigantopelta aegis]